MLKRDLLKKLESLPDDAYIVFALFEDAPKGGYRWRLLNNTIGRPDNPANVINLSNSYSGITTHTLEDMGALGRDFDDEQEGGTL